MKKYLPIILPIAALALVAFLGMRWYRSREVTDVKVPEVASSAPIVPMVNDQDALDKLARGIGNYQAINLDTAPTVTDAAGEIRYQFQNERVLFSVNANLPTDDGEQYRVFVKAADSSEATDLGELRYSKGGLIVSHSLPITSLPLTIEIRRGDKVILTGSINAPAASEAQEPNLPLDNQADQE